MMERNKKKNASSILHRRYIKDESSKKQLEDERINAKVAHIIHDFRKAAGLTQGELAKLIGSTQSVVSRLEDSDYDGHSLTMVDRIATALNQKIKVVVEPKEISEDDQVYEAFRIFMKNLRRSKGLRIDQLSEKIGFPSVEIQKLEQQNEYFAPPLMLHRLGKYYGVPQDKLIALSNRSKQVSDDLREEASRFAAQSESFSKLTKDEKKNLDRFMKYLKQRKK